MKDTTKDTTVVWCIIGSRFALAGVSYFYRGMVYMVSVKVRFTLSNKRSLPRWGDSEEIRNNLRLKR